MKRFEAISVRRSHSFTLSAPPAQVMPLLCPVREEEWVVGWENETYELVYSASGFVEEGCIFRTSFPSGEQSIWTCIKYDRKNYLVEFLVQKEDMIMWRANLALTQSDANSSTIQFIYTYTAISEVGNAFIENYTNAEHIKATAGLAMMLDHYLRHGKKMTV